MNLRRLAIRINASLPKHDSTAIWVNKQHDKLLICNMESSHIKNCIKMLLKIINETTVYNVDATFNYLKRKKIYEKEIQIFKNELSYREAKYK